MKEYKGYIFLAIAGILNGTITVSSQLMKNLGLSLFETSLYPLLFSLTLFVPIVIIKKELFARREIKIFLVYGLIQALLQIFQMGSVNLGTPVAIVAFLLYTQPIYTAVLGKFMLSEKISKRKILAIFVTIVGLLVLLRPWDVQNVGNPIGIVLAVLGGIFLSLWVVYGKKTGMDKNPVRSGFGLMMFAVIWLAIFAPFISLINDSSIIKFTAYPVGYWLYFVGIAAISQVIPLFIFYRGIRSVSASTAGIILLIEPVSALILASLLFSQPITLNIIIGGAIILLSNWLVITEKK
jgi:drug/metabolite transporter (DMT)-like permease